MLCISLLAMTAGCTTEVVKISVQPTVLPPGNTSPLHAALLLNEDLAKYKYEFHVTGGDVVFPLGLALQDYARHVATNSFKQVDEASTPEAAFANSSANIVLIPRAVKAEFSFGTRLQNPFGFTLVMEWLAKDRATQNTIWLKTITADVADEGSGVFNFKVVERREALMQKLLDNLSVQTYETIQRAPELGYSQAAVEAGKSPPGDPKVFVVMLGLKSSDPGQIVHTLKLLRTPESSAAVPAILPLLNHKNANVVRDACRTLAVIATKDVIPNIEPLLNDKRSAVRKDAQDAIDKLRANP
jgi:hypothetical protein